MIRKLRRKFVLFNMATVALILMIVFFTVMFSAYRSYQSSGDEALRFALMRGMDGSHEPAEIGRPRDSRMFMQLTVTVLLDDSGTVRSLREDSATVSEDVLAEALSRIAESGSTSGYLSGLYLRFETRNVEEGTLVALLDVQSEVLSLQRQLLISIGVGLNGLAAFFFLSMALSRLLLRPVEQAWAQQKQFVADASHELKTPLTVILANLGILRAHPDATVREESRWIDNTEAEGQRMKSLVDDLLTLAMTEDGSRETVFSAVDLSDIVMSAALAFESVAFEKHLRFSADIQESLSVLGDSTQLKRLAGTLLDNAVKYAPTGGVVQIRLNDADGHARLSVYNSGAGLDPADLPHVFERFYRADKSRGSGGFGLGLAIAKGIADVHGASLTVESHPNEGTTFIAEFIKEAHV